jgi:hypothetical protein
MATNAIFGVAQVTFFPPHTRQLPEMRGSYSRASLMAASPATMSPHEEGTIVAKNKNQNRQREQRGDRRRPEAPERDRAPLAEDHLMPAATQAPRRQQKRFGHN